MGGKRWLGLLLLLAWAGPAAAQFRQDEVEPRDYRYRDDHFISVFTYTPRLSHRWAWGWASDELRRWWWSHPAVGYAVSAGSVSNDDLWVYQGAIVRLPLGDHLSGEYRFLQEEDYDSRYLRNEVELLVRLFRPGPSLGYSLGGTPAEDGLFLGALGLIDADKEFADVGVVGGWRGEWLGLRLDLIAPDYFYNEKAEDFAEYRRRPITLRAKVGARLRHPDLELTAWWDHDLPLELRQPAEDDLRFRFRQFTGGAGVRWGVGEGVRWDLQVWGERTRKRRRTTDPLRNDDTDREAVTLLSGLELDRPPLLASSSRLADVVLVSVFAHWMDEVRQAYLAPEGSVVRRVEAYGELGYVLGIPSFSEQVQLAVRLTTQHGVVDFREVEQRSMRDSEHTRYMARGGLALEAEFLDGVGIAVIQFTLRMDEPSFGGGNGQVILRF